MSDNTALNPGTGGDVIATDDLTTMNGLGVSGVKIQRVKVTFGADSDARDVEPDYPLPTRVYNMLGVVAAGQAVMASSLPVVIASDQSLLNASVTGNVASNAADNGNPVKVGGVYNAAPPVFTSGRRGDLQLDICGNMKVALAASTGTALATAASNADSVAAETTAIDLVTVDRNTVWDTAAWQRMRGDANGVVVQPALSSAFWSYAAASGGIVNTATAVAIKAAAGAGVRNYLTTLTIGHDALGGATEIAVRDGAAGTVLWRGRLQTGAVEDKQLEFLPPLKGTANTLMEVVTLTAVTGGVYVNASGYAGS